MTTEYRVRLDRSACDGVFACLVRDDRFVEASDGLATIDGGRDGSHQNHNGDGDQLVTFTDDRLEAAEQAARSCPVDAIDVLEGDDE
ncbi:ferredoxin [Halalkalicoccus sp. NIPERK01]|uniref:ferredoxin n=1 Tax=Halalkalicoccus sp. NIPERK01 TaxID=3053469 RepID=UPI00256EFAEC|nr:ferredoxin [Halalkalicoccus sp. NIPERK01]MDL5363119.1 ferredoxin [Halalkalicoccus sp. NIPERK01]